MTVNHLVCVNCGKQIKELLKKYSNSVKVATCSFCTKLVDQYIEFESVIILVDIMLLSKPVYRHLIYNRNFKLFWKLSLMLLLLDSFTLWVQQRGITTTTTTITTTTTTTITTNSNNNLNQNNSSNKIYIDFQQGFYTCCLQNIIDFFVYTSILFLVTCFNRRYFTTTTTNIDNKKLAINILKAHTLANFSKFFLLPIVLWRENTTDLSAKLHSTLVFGHHICSLVFIYTIVTNVNMIIANLTVLPIYIIKEYIMLYVRDILRVN